MQIIGNLLLANYTRSAIYLLFQSIIVCNRFVADRFVAQVVSSDEILIPSTS